MPLAPLESPYRAFPSRGAVPALAGLVLPCGFAFDRPTARHVPRVSRPLSPARRPLAAAGPKARRTGRPGRRFPGVARRRASPVAGFVCGVSSRIGRARRSGGRHARFEALLPSRVRSRHDLRPGQGTAARSVLSWASSPLEISPRKQRARFTRERTRSGRTRATHILESSALATCSPDPCSDRGA